MFLIAAVMACFSLRAESQLKANDHEDHHIAALEKKVAANPDDMALRYDLGLAYNEEAMHGDESALEQAIATFKLIVRKDPSQLKAQAMLGSCLVMKAQYASVFKKLDYCEEGYGILDQVVGENPDDPDLRLIRGVNAARSPAFLGRGDIADEDFAWLLADVESGNNDYDDHYRRTIFFYVGDYFLQERDNRCVELLMTAQSTPGAPRLTADINDALRQAKKKFPSTYASLNKK